MDIRVSPHCDAIAFRKLLHSWIIETGPGCSMEITKVNDMESKDFATAHYAYNFSMNKYLFHKKQRNLLSSKISC